MGILDVVIAQALSRIKEAPTKVEAALRPVEEALAHVAKELRDMEAHGESLERQRENILSAARLKADSIVENAMQKGREIERKTGIMDEHFKSAMKQIAG